MADSGILRFNRDLLFELETDGTPEGSSVSAPFSGTIPGGGPILTFDSTVETLIPLIVDINPVQEGSGDPSPNNIRPINGWNSIEIYVSPTKSPEDGKTISINLPQTVYGGVLDTVSGKLTIDTEASSFNGTENIGLETQGGYNRFYSFNRFTKLTASTYRCSHFKPDISPIGNNATDNAMCSYGKTIYWRADAYATVDAMKNYFAQQNTNGTPVTLVSKLQTPIEIQLTPTEVKTLIGPNNIWSNSGDAYTTVTTENVTYKIIGGAEDVQRFNKIWDSLLLYRNGGFTDEYRNLSGEGDKIIPHGPAVLKEE